MDLHTILLGWLIVGVVCGVIAAIIGMDKGMAFAGLLYGLLLGPLGIILASIAEDGRIQCPVCRELINPMVSVCPKCLSSMVNLRNKSTSYVPRMMPQEAAEAEPPRVIPQVPRVVAKTPRVVEKATRVVARMTQALNQVTQAFEQVPQFFVRKPMRVIRNMPRAVQTEPLAVTPKAPRVVKPEPPREIPKAPRVVEKAPKFFIHKPGDEVRGPFDLAQIQALLECGAITEETQYCREGETEWKPSLTV